MKRKPGSLTLRIILLSGIWVIIALALTGGMLLNFYRLHIEEHYDAHVLMHMEEMTSAVHLSENGVLRLGFPPSDPRYRELGSGWYWEVRHQDKTLARSPSLGTSRIDLGDKPPTSRGPTRILDGPRGHRLRVQTRLVTAEPANETVFLVASAPVMGVRDEVSGLAQHLVVSFSVLGLFLLMAVVLQVGIALKPIKAIGRGISDIHLGRSGKVEGRFPSDVQPLVDELNNLVEHNAMLLRRARNQLGDLAHSVKNPLTVINNEARAMDPELGGIILKETGNIASSVEHHLSRARAFGTTKVVGPHTRVLPIAEDLAFALKRIHIERDLEIDVSRLCSCHVRCESQDLEEMLGNLMDNACKWADKNVVVYCERLDDRCLLHVEDDGPGIPADRHEQVLQRGQRLDESREGHGLGLGIVQDIVELYDGGLTLGRSKRGGLAAHLNLPGA